MNKLPLGTHKWADLNNPVPQHRKRNGRYTSGSLRKFTRKSLYALLALAVGVLLFAAGGAFYSSTTLTYAEGTSTTVEAPSPILEHIADCESGNGKPGTATQTKNGQTLIHMNSNGTYDQGEFQINSSWNKKAAELGYNLSVETDNKTFAKWLYANIGTSPWSSSQHCWAR